MINWGESLPKELAARRCIVFLGAGASMSSVASDGSRPPSWEKLLSSLIELVLDDAEKRLSKKLLKRRMYLDCAEIVARGARSADYHAKLRSLLEIPRFPQSKVHEAILKIDPKVVITTNFDTIYESYCRDGSASEGYRVIKHTDKHLVTHLRTPIRCVVKAHGCITDPTSIVLTRSDFFRAKQEAPGFFSVLSALCLTNTVLFVGYSLADPDVQIALEYASLAYVSDAPHYFVCEQGTPQAIKDAQRRAYNVEFLEFPRGRFDILEKSLAELADRVDSLRESNVNL